MPNATALKLKTRSKCLHVAFDNGDAFDLGFELLRVYSPSAEVRGHGVGQSVLQTGKKNVVLNHAEPVGHYGVKLIFDDGHDSGIYTWDYLYSLGHEADQKWAEYLNQLQQANASREPGVQILKL